MTPPELSFTVPTTDPLLCASAEPDKAAKVIMAARKVLMLRSVRIFLFPRSPASRWGRTDHKAYISFAQSFASTKLVSYYKTCNWKLGGQVTVCSRLEWNR